MPSLTEGKYKSDFLLWEADHEYSRKVVIVDAGTYITGTVMGMITATGHYVQLAPAEGDGSQVAAGIMLHDVDASAGELEAVIINDQSLVVFDELTWPDDITEAQQETAEAQLEAINIKERKEA